MCGIVGGVKWTNGNFDEAELRSANKLISHRGPDGSGLFVKDGVGLGSRRLAIIDISGGMQPMRSDDGLLTCVYNGEIYNFKILRKQLEARGYKFRTKSDTEVLLHGWREWAGGLFSKLNGMFAIAIWDEKRHSLILSRDHAGIKPLYYYKDKEKLVFASEIKSLFCFGNVKKKLNEAAVLEYLALRYPLGNQTMYENIFCFPKASWGEVTGKDLTIQNHWDYPALNKNEVFEASVKKTKKILKSAVSSQLMSDVPLGVFLSGGLDSSAIVALAAPEVKRLNTISVGFADSNINELEYARMVADKFKTKHTEVVINRVNYFEEMEGLIRIKDEPLAVQNEVAIYLMSRELKKNFTVVLSGEGADELFGGYPKYFNTQGLARLMEVAGRLPIEMRKGLSSLISKSGRQLSRDLAEVVESKRVMDSYFMRWPLGINRQSLAVLRETSFKAVGGRVEDYLADYFSGMTEGWQERFLHYDYDHHLVNLLGRVDKMTMAASVEARVPFLDKTVVDYVGSLPMKLKCQTEPKALLKEAMRGMLPKEIIDRKKMGFPVPLDEWMKQSAFNEQRDILLKKNSFIGSYCRRDKLKQLLKNTNNNELIFRMINLELWYKMTWK